jgi:ATP-GRASP peptide maturase of grasp-with-spasm system
MGLDVLRVNDDDASPRHTIEFTVELETLSFQVDGRVVHLNDIEAVWYRKGKHWLCNQFHKVSFSEHPHFSSYVAKKLSAEELRLSQFLHFMIENNVKTLGSAMRPDLNKLLVLHAASRVGLLVPQFCISNSKKWLMSFARRRSCVTKAISDGFYLFETGVSNTGYYSYTEVVDAAMLNELSDRPSPSLLQEQILKQFDVRVFFLEGRCYAMAIFSQSDDQTKVDFRRYNERKANRGVPFNLPPDVEDKLARLFSALDLRTGSADFVCDQAGRFIFLEINPVGQFGMVSEPCNYFLERQVALTLTQYATENR